jgi:hypothetical protein
MSDIRDATVRGAVELTEGAAAFFELFLDFFAAAFFAAAFFAAALRLAADVVVVFFLVLDWDGSGAETRDARRITARIRSFRYSIEFS